MSGHTCQKLVFREYRHYPCHRNASVQIDGIWYCWQHNPEYIKQKKVERDEEFERQSKARKESWRRRDAERNACDGVSTEELETIKVLDLLEQIKYG